jgi:hypothetical protein
LIPAAIFYCNGPFSGVRSTVLPNPPPETLAGDAYVGMGVGWPQYEKITYHRLECVDNVWWYEVRPA